MSNGKERARFLLSPTDFDALMDAVAHHGGVPELLGRAAADPYLPGRTVSDRVALDTLARLFCREVWAGGWANAGDAEQFLGDVLGEVAETVKDTGRLIVARQADGSIRLVAAPQ